MRQSMSLAPPRAELIMPTQAFSRRPLQRAAAHSPTPWLARLITFGGSISLTAVAGYYMHQVLPLSSVDSALGATNSQIIVVLLWLLLGLFITTFGWVALTAMVAFAGVVAKPGQQLASSNAPLSGKTALLMPVYNEDPASACAALAAMAEELGQLGLDKHFEIFVISDSDRPEIWRAELVAVRYLRQHLAGLMPIWYRRREHNTARKAGNVRDFINRWGRRYDYMIVLDADSLIAGNTLATLVREMDADADLGILQTLPRLFGGETLFARLQQFSGVVYGPVFARGLSAWQGQDGNYWGHNAIIRVSAFAASAGLPKMAGPKPIGGEIRSHDFVEAALIRRAGWTVRMLTDLAGSWEECPPTLLDASIRDRRWAQGNVQHLGVIFAKGLRWPSRAHMLMGIMNYVASPLWLATVFMGLMLSTWLAWHPASFAASENSQFGSQVFDSKGMIMLFGFTMGLLLVPKIVGLGLALVKREIYPNQRRTSLLVGAFLEQLFAILHAPIIMSFHSSHLWEIFRGKDSGWAAQHRRGRSIPWAKLVRRHRGQAAAGSLATAYLVWLSSPLLYWLLPMTIGLIFSVPLSALSGSRMAGRLLAKQGLLNTPEETLPPGIMLRRRALISTLSKTISHSAQARPALVSLHTELENTAA
ncbi:MAG: membrane glycosyltransferase [Pseudohongiellaceae bacterium]|jgi:membrane glycosyltransferase